MSCGVGCRHDLDLELLWLWHWLVTAALIPLLAWGLPCAVGAALKSKKRKKKKRGKQSETSLHPLVSWVVWRGGQGPSLQRRYCTAHSSRHTLSEPSHIMQPGVGWGWGEKDEISICLPECPYQSTLTGKEEDPSSRGGMAISLTPLSLSTSAQC